MRRLCTAFVGLLIPLAWSPAQAQTWSDSIGCAEKADTASMRVTLPIEVLDHLERTSNSVFVHAFLLRYISDPAAGEHRLSRCARNFTAADLDLTDFRKLRQNLSDATAIIEALRATELARQRTAELVAASPQLSAVVAQLRADPSHPNLEASREAIAAAHAKCGAASSGACGALRTAVVDIEALRRARSALEGAGELTRQKAEEASRVAKDAAGASSDLAVDIALMNRMTAGEVTVDSAQMTALQQRIDSATAVVDSLVRTRVALDTTVSKASAAKDSAAAEVADVQARLQSTLGTLEADLRRDPARNSSVAALQGTSIGTHLAPFAVPPAQSAAVNPTTRSANLMLELTDFIIARARRELVNAFVVNLNDLVVKEALLQHGFRNTWDLMRGVSTLGDGRLNAVEVGRIPLPVWRATLASDFVMLPVNLLNAGTALCPSEAAPPAASVPQAPVTDAGCLQRVAVLRPLAPVASRLLEGDAVFDILRDAGSLTSPQGPNLPPEWRRISQGLTVIAAMAETYLAQGHAPTADPARHPYVLTAQSLTQVPQRQRDAFVRLLLVRAVPSASDIPATIDEAALQNATAGVAGLLERIAARPPAADARPADAALVVRNGFDALIFAADVGRVLATEGAAARLDTVKTRWRAVSGAIEPIVARDFGLAFARTTVLLRELRGIEVPRPMLTFAALASSLTEAQNGQQIRQAFESAASPVGGWQAKRYGEGGASLTAFPGLAAGFEHVIREGDDPESVGRRAGAMGVSLPVGIELQFKRKGVDGDVPDCIGWICGYGVFVPLIDLGAMLSYRVGGGDSVVSEPNASVRQVFAPGAYLSFALSRTFPATLLVGGQLMPSLRTVDAAEGPVSRSAVRYGIGIGMDVMLFGF